LGSVETQRRYLDKELEDIQDFNNKRLDFYRYWRSGSSSLDDIYFRRGKTDMELYMESFYFELDPKFSTNYDFKVARILADDMLQIFIRSELDALEESRYKNNDSKSQLNININAKKTEIIELLYALDTINFFGEKSLNRLTVMVENTFNINLGNISRTFADMKSRNILTPFLDRTRESLLKRMVRKNRAN